MMYKGFSLEQARYLRKSMVSWLNVAEGGKRAGKNVINALAFAMQLEHSLDQLHMVAAVNASLARLNIVECNGFGLKAYFGGRLREVRQDGKPLLLIKTKQGERTVIIEGGQKISDAARIKGLSLGSVYITEANEVHKGFMLEAVDRTLLSKSRKVFLDLNAKPQGHWFYKDFLDRLADNSGVNHGHFTILNNPAISADEKERLLSLYNKQSSWYKQDILGLRVNGDDGIYRGFGDKHILPPSEVAALQPQAFAIGIDVGGRDATCATLIGIGPFGLCLIDGYYHKQDKDSFMTHESYVKAIVSAIEQWAERYPALAHATIFCESAEKLFRQALIYRLRDRGFMMPVYPSYKKDGILMRIRLFDMLINQGRLFIASHMKLWIDALYNARWDRAAQGNGHMVRVDDGSYAVDCLDSAEYAAMPFKQSLLNGNGGTNGMV